MSTHDYSLSNQSGASFRSDLNNALAAILSNNSNGSSPSTTVAYSIWADTSAAKLKIRNSANDAWVDLINLDGTIARDIKLTGASANINFDQSDNALEFNDNAKAVFGSGEDLTISHDGSNSIINDAGTGELQLQRGGSTVVALSSTGADLTGDLTASGKFIASSSSSGDYIRVYASSGTGKWDIYGNGANLRIGDNDSAGAVVIDTNVGIGTTSPSVTLDIEATTPTIRLTDSDATGTPESEIRGGGGDLVLSADRDNEKSSTIIGFHTDGTERMRIDDAGRVGIGTTSMSHNLAVVTASGDAKILVSCPGHPSLTLQSTSGSDHTGVNFGDSDDVNAGMIQYTNSSNAMQFHTNGSESLRIDSSGDVGIGSASPNSRLTVVSDSTSSSNFAFTVYNSASGLLFYLQDDGELSTGTSTESPYNKGTSNSANVFVTSLGVLKRTTSSERYKKDITDATWGLADVLKLRPITFKSNATGADADDKTYAGFTAEAIHALGLTEFVQYNDSNEPDALNYANMVALMAKAIQELSVKVTALEGS